MRKVELRMNEQMKYEVIKDLVDYNKNKNRASKKIGLSRRQIYSWFNDKKDLTLIIFNLVELYFNVHAKKHLKTNLQIFFSYLKKRFFGFKENLC